VCSNLAGRVDLRGSADFVALQRLVAALTELASLDLRSSDDDTRETDLRSVLDHLRVVIEPDWEEIGGSVAWDVPASLPPVAATAHGLLQILLNLCQNSLRAATARSMPPQLRVAVVSSADDVVVTVTDNGPGVTAPEQLFHLHPPGAGAHGSGLGLYISRELARSVGGDLQYVRTDDGAAFRVIVPQARHRLGGQRAS
jgi:C4-dicarboxylate-specific signal transduction histidine kinase